ncbi:MAG: 3-hydroxyacyl-CoA dehydrogenase family protein [Deinococcaceae bacterium]
MKTFLHAGDDIAPFEMFWLQLRSKLDNLNLLADDMETADVVVSLSPDAFNVRKGTSLYALCHEHSAEEIATYNPQATVVGFSFVPPYTETTIVELLRPLGTPPEGIEQATSYFQALGVTSTEVPDSPGGVCARVVVCLINEAVSALAEGVADAPTIDSAMQLGTHYPRGPLAWADLIGPHRVLGILNALFDFYGEDRYRPHPLLKRMVMAQKCFHSERTLCTNL